MVLRPGGTFVAKIFRGRDITLLYAQLKEIFRESVNVYKPRSSRNSSIEAFVVCKGYQIPDGWQNSSNDEMMEIPPFFSCGDLDNYYDSERTYDLPTGVKSEDGKYVGPKVSNMPISPPYTAALNRK